MIDMGEGMLSVSDWCVFDSQGFTGASMVGLLKSALLSAKI